MTNFPGSRGLAGGVAHDVPRRSASIGKLGLRIADNMFAAGSSADAAKAGELKVLIILSF
ncbi:MAG: hypothetical protein QF412_11480 [Planctomycetota bacterium]|jgi:hypothetical protein|nr:hypothetical protein [Planctomycetota bacterium]